MSSSEEKREIKSASFSADWVYSEEMSLEEKVSNTLLHLSSIDGVLSIEKLLGELKLQKSNILSLYDVLSSSIKRELMDHLDKLFELKLNNSKLEKQMDTLLYSVRISSPFIANYNSEQLPQSKEYRQFLQLYSDHTEGIQYTVKLKGKISLLLDSQKLLDKSYASKMAHIDYQIISLGRILDNLTEAKKEEVGALYFSQFNRLEELIKEITDNEEKLGKLKRSMNITREGFFNKGINETFSSELKRISEISLKNL